MEEKFHFLDPRHSHPKATKKKPKWREKACERLNQSNIKIMLNKHIRAALNERSKR